MREIKFRAWCPVKKEMEYEVNVNQGKPVKHGYMWFNTENTIHNSELLQYTGLKDKNGKEIYEGDIVRLVSTEWAGDEPIIDVVEWGLGDRSYPAFDLKKFSYETEMNSFSYIFNSGYYEIEIIGNIYENPELLGGEEND